MAPLRGGAFSGRRPAVSTACPPGARGVWSPSPVRYNSNFGGIQALKIIARLAALAMLTLGAGAVMAQDGVPYTSGAVDDVSSIRTEPGQFNAYLRYLAGPYRKIMDEAKAQGLVTDYSFYAA